MASIYRRESICWLLAFLAGACFTLALAPFNYKPVAIISILAYLVVIVNQASNYKTSLSVYRSIVFGLGFHLTGASWFYGIFRTVFEWNNLESLLATLFACSVLSVVWFGALGFLVAFFSRKIFFVVSFSCLWALAEWSKTVVPISLPWNYAGYTFIDTPLAGLAPIVGVFGLSWIACFTACTLYFILKEIIAGRSLLASLADKSSILSLSVCLAIWIGAVLLSPINWAEAKTPNPIKVSIFQTNIGSNDNSDPKASIEAQLNVKRFTVKEWADTQWNADFVIWPEVTIQNIYSQNRDSFLNRLFKLAETYNRQLVIGVRTMDNDYVYNSIVANGSPTPTYNKHKLVPFREQNIIMDAVNRYLLDAHDSSQYAAGNKVQKVFSPGALSMAALICYETAFPDYVASKVRQTSVITVVSNDAWANGSIGAHQNLQAVRMRALENGRFLLRSSNTGFSAIIDPKGDIVEQAPEGVSTLLRGEVFPIEELTPFTRFGSTPVVGFSLLTLLLLFCAGHPKATRQN